MKAKILVVEDDLSILRLEKTLIESLGYQVLSATKAVDAYKMICMEKPDAIIMDIMLPDKNGYSLAKKLKSDCDTKNIPIGFVSGKSEPAEMAEGLRCGGAIFLPKPFTSNAFKTVVKSLVRTKDCATKGQALANRVAAA